jgi:glucose-6-phosphate isomerase
MDLAEAANLRDKIKAMYSGDHINSTEDRAVLHVATRARRDQVCPRTTLAAGAGGRGRGRRGWRL